MNQASQYLLVLYRFEQQRSPPIPPGAVADALDRSPAATTEMFQRLDARGLVDHEPYAGATLTAEGRTSAEELYETYVTLSRFFRDVLGLDDHETDAMELAGAVSPAVADRLASVLLPEAEPRTGRDGPNPSASRPDGP